MSKNKAPSKKESTKASKGTGKKATPSKKKKDDGTTTSTTTMRLPVKLRDDELLQRGGDLARQIQKIARAEEEASQESKRLKGDIALMEMVKENLTRSIASGEETREVECKVVKDYNRGMVTTIRKDTGEIIDERIMRADERQTDAFQRESSQEDGEAPDREVAKGKREDPFADGSGSGSASTEETPPASDSPPDEPPQIPDEENA